MVNPPLQPLFPANDPVRVVNGAACPPPPHCRTESEEARNITTSPGFDPQTVQSVASSYTD